MWSIKLKKKTRSDQNPFFSYCWRSEWFDYSVHLVFHEDKLTPCIKQVNIPKKIEEENYAFEPKISKRNFIIKGSRNLPSLTLYGHGKSTSLKFSGSLNGFISWTINLQSGAAGPQFIRHSGGKWERINCNNHLLILLDKLKDFQKVRQLDW